MKRIFSCLLALMLIFSFSSFAFAEEESSKELKFRDGEFIILQLSDPQDDVYPAYDMINFVSLALDTVKPDLVVLTGDLVEDKRGADAGVDDEDTREGVCVYDDEGEIKHDETLENAKIAADNVLSIINNAKIPFVTAQGNNDHICGVTNKEWLEIYSKYEYCLTTDMSEDEEDRIDCNVLIKGSDGKAAFNIWCMDTGKKEVTKEQINWYKEKSNLLKEENGGKAVPSFAFQHIYVSEIGNLFKRCNLWDSCCIADGLGLYKLDRSKATGNFYEITKTPGKSSKEFKAWLKQGDVIGAYFGHEHYGNYTGKYKGIELGLTNGCEFAKSGPYGIRVLTLHENDIENYDNEVFTYEGSVKTNDASFVPLVNEDYDPVYSTREEMLAAVKENIINNLKAIIKEIFD